ncbi:hypothetical protein AAVH_34468, partial [Aphelenchoides avenae]
HRRHCRQPAQYCRLLDEQRTEDELRLHNCPRHWRDHKRSLVYSYRPGSRNAATAWQLPQAYHGSRLLLY